MKKTIDTLVEDIYSLFDPNNPHTLNEDNLETFCNNLKHLLRNRFGEQPDRSNLRMSSIGQGARRQWYNVNMPEEAEPFEPHTLFKFLYGDLIEEIILLLAVEAGHEVRGQQDELDVEGVKGHRDAIIDNVLVDVKSASSYSYQDFASGKIHEVDKFGYADQLGIYHHASSDCDRDVAAFVAVDKQNGYICVDKYARNEKDYPAHVNNLKKIVTSSEPPERCYPDEEFQKGGNRKLGTQCSYCPFKFTCYPKLRAFNYSGKPVFLTRVMKEPRVQEITRNVKP